MPAFSWCVLNICKSQEPPPLISWTCWLVVTGTWPWKIPYKWRFLAGKIIYSYIIICLVVWNMIFFHSVGNVIIPTDFHSIIFQRGFGRPKPVKRCPLGSPKNRMDVALIRSPVTRPSPKTRTGASCGVWSARRQVKKRFCGWAGSELRN